MKWKWSKSLENKYIRNIQVSADGDYIIFFCDKDSVMFEAEADCCSKSYIYEINGRLALTGEPVKEVLSKDLGSGDIKTEDENDCVQSYCITLVTSKGRCDIVFRNESNGYYGGSLEQVKSNDDGRTWTSRNFKENPGFKNVEADSWTLGD